MNTPIAPLDFDRLSGLVFELSSQLHAERMHRIALERALEQAGLIDPAVLPGLADDPTVCERGRLAVDDSIAHLMRVLTESRT
jgi:hypothetical protein